MFFFPITVLPSGQSLKWLINILYAKPFTFLGFIFYLRGEKHIYGRLAIEHRNIMLAKYKEEWNHLFDMKFVKNNDNISIYKSWGVFLSICV